MLSARFAGMVLVLLPTSKQSLSSYVYVGRIGEWNICQVFYVNEDLLYSKYMVCIRMRRPSWQIACFNGIRPLSPKLNH